MIAVSTFMDYQANAVIQGWKLTFSGRSINSSFKCLRVCLQNFFQRSPCLLNLLKIVLIFKPSGWTFRLISVAATGVDTGAPSKGRSE